MAEAPPAASASAASAAAAATTPAAAPSVAVAATPVVAPDLEPEIFVGPVRFAGFFVLVHADILYFSAVRREAWWINRKTFEQTR